MPNNTRLVANRMPTEAAPLRQGDPGREEPTTKQERLERIRNILLQARSAILREHSAAAVAFARRSSDAEADILDRTASELEQNLCLLLRERGHTKLKAIEDALQRIEEGTFGICEDCGDEIPRGRLEAMPFATTCRDCKAIQERRNKLLYSEKEDPFSYEWHGRDS